jgi:hypothetical protein
METPSSEEQKRCSYFASIGAAIRQWFRHLWISTEKDICVQNY